MKFLPLKHITSVLYHTASHLWPGKVLRWWMCCTFPYLPFFVPQTHAEIEVWTAAKPTNSVVLGRSASKMVEVLAGNQSTWGTTRYLNSFNFSDDESCLFVSADRNNTYSNFFSSWFLLLTCSVRTVLRFR